MTKRISRRAISVFLAAFFVFSAAAPTTARVAGEPFGSTFPVTEVSQNQNHPAVAYNTARQEYLVVWQNEWPSGGTTFFNIAGQPLSKDGQLVGDGFNIYGGTNGHFPDVAYNVKNDTYLVVWQQEDPLGPGIFANLVSAGGQVSAFPLAIRTSSGMESYTHPAVAYAFTSDRFLVVYESHFTPMPLQYEIWGQVITSDGQLEGMPFLISDDPGDGSYRKNPDLAYNRSRNEYLVVWEQRDPATDRYRIHVRRVTGGGDPLFPESTQLSIYNSYNHRASTIAAIPMPGTAGEYLVAWEMDYSAGDSDIYACIVSGEGAAAVPMGLDTTFAPAYAPAVSGNEEDRQYLVTWIYEYTGNSGGSPTTDLSVDALPIEVGSTAVTVQKNRVAGLSAENQAVSEGGAGRFLVLFDEIPAGDTDSEVFGRFWGDPPDTFSTFIPVVIR